MGVRVIGPPSHGAKAALRAVRGESHVSHGDTSHAIPRPAAARSDEEEYGQHFPVRHGPAPAFAECSAGRMRRNFHRGRPAGVLRRTAAAGAMVGIGLAALGASEMQPSGTLTLEDGARLERKLISILGHADTESPEARLTPLLESEINAFLRFQGASQLPTGITEPTIRIGDAALVSAEAIVDLEVIRQQRARGWLDPLQYLTGRLQITASGTVRSGGGVAQVDIQSVTVAGIPVPVQVLQELVRHFTRIPDHPDGTSLDEPIPLPYRITELQLSPGQAIIVQ